jgi:hypothetical protein
VAIDAKKIMLLPDFTFICGCSKGYLFWNGFSAPRLSSLQINPLGDINDMFLTENRSADIFEYAVAADTGLFFIRANLATPYGLTQLKTIHRKGEKIKTMAKIRENVMLIAVKG